MVEQRVAEQLPARLVPPEYPERLLILGSNRSGKSVFAGELLAAGYPRWVVVDIKWDFHPPLEDYQVLHEPKDRRWESADRIIYRPHPQYQTKPWLEYTFAKLFYRAQRTGKKKPFILYVDEGLALAKKRAIENLAIIAVTGPALGVGLWIGSQRASWIPVEIKTEAWRIYVFYLNDEEDEKVAVRFAKGQLSMAQLRDQNHSYQFLEIRRGNESGGVVKVTFFPPVRITGHRHSKRPSGRPAE